MTAARETAAFAAREQRINLANDSMFIAAGKRNSGDGSGRSRLGRWQKETTFKLFLVLTPAARVPQKPRELFKLVRNPPTW